MPQEIDRLNKNPDDRSNNFVHPKIRRDELAAEMSRYKAELNGSKVSILKRAAVKLSGRRVVVAPAKGNPVGPKVPIEVTLSGLDLGESWEGELVCWGIHTDGEGVSHRIQVNTWEIVEDRKK
jgi:hypothetical protein